MFLVMASNSAQHASNAPLIIAKEERKIVSNVGGSKIGKEVVEGLNHLDANMIHGFDLGMADTATDVFLMDAGPINWATHVY